MTISAAGTFCGHSAGTFFFHGWLEPFCSGVSGGVGEMKTWPSLLVLFPCSVSFRWKEDGCWPAFGGFAGESSDSVDVLAIVSCSHRQGVGEYPCWRMTKQI